MWGRQMFLQLSFVCASVCVCVLFFLSLSTISCLKWHGCFIQKCFRLISSNVRPLNLTEQMFLFQKQIAPRLISQKRRSLKKKQEQARRCFLFSPSSCEDRYLKEIYKDRGELTVLCWGWEWQDWKGKASKPGGRGRKCKKLRIITIHIYCTCSKAVTPRLSRRSAAVLIKEVNHFQELWYVAWLASPQNSTRL